MYDRQNRIKKQAYQLLGSDGKYTTYAAEYKYRSSDGALTYVDGLDNCFGDYAFEYDDIARLSARYNYYFRQDYTYRNISSSQTTTQIANIAYSKRDGGTNFNPFSLAYTYDALGNIKTITGTGISGQNASYVYDVQSQLTSAVVDGKNYSYEYDTYGNIRKAVENGTTHTYTYGDADWKDLLTAYDGQSNTYDEIGNPISYYNGTRWAFDWEKGRQLVAAESSVHDIEYTYDMAGIRDSKTVDGVTYNYLTLDGKVVRQTWGSNVLDIIYDNSGLPYAFKYNGAYYIYVLNQQGDVIRIVNSTGETVAEYRYDAWGNVIYSNGSMAEINPIRYRGYYYDAETGFYYLQSRYFDPSISRFINADQFACTGQDFAGHNMFVYCGNNPVNRLDLAGNWWHIAVGAIVGAVTAFVSTVATDFIEDGTVDLCAAGISAGFGALSGALAATGCGTLIQMAGGALLSGAENVASQAYDDIKNDRSVDIDTGEVLLDMVIGGFSSRGNGIRKDNLNFLKSQKIRAQKRIENGFKYGTVQEGLTELWHAGKYYLSQTATIFYKPLINDGISTVIDDVRDSSRKAVFDSLDNMK